MAVSIIMKNNYEVILENTSYRTVKSAIEKDPNSTWYIMRGNVFKAENILVIREVKK